MSKGQIDLWLYRDRKHKWHERMAHAAQNDKRFKLHFFSGANEVGPGVVFGRLQHDAKYRATDKQVWAQLDQKRLARLVPTALEARLYDNKIEQTKLMGQHMPVTYLACTVEEAVNTFDRINFPIFLKSSAGAGGNNVRFVEDRGEAELIVRKMFLDRFIWPNGQMHRGCVIIQEYIESIGDFDYRVIRIGSEWMILRRGNRQDVPIASGSGDERPLEVLDTNDRRALRLAQGVCIRYDLRFCGLDIIVSKKDRRPYLLETTCGWPTDKFHLHKFKSGKLGHLWRQIILDEIWGGNL